VKKDVNIDELPDLALATSEGYRLVVLIDGRSGAGKTTLALGLAGVLAQRLGKPVQTVSLDDVYPGWDGLVAGAATVPQMLASVGAGYRRYDWVEARQTGWVPLDPKAPIVIEGCGAITPASAPSATLRIWVDGPEAVRRQAVTARDGDVTAWWDAWADQEQAHIAADDPIALADVNVRSRTRVGVLPHSTTLVGA